MFLIFEQIIKFKNANEGRKILARKNAEKKLDELYPGIGVDTLIKGIKINSKEVEEGDLFVCTMGVTADRHDFIDDAKAHGAAALVVSKDIKDPDIPTIKVPDTNRELPYLCQKF